MSAPDRKSLYWIASSRKDLEAMPAANHGIATPKREIDLVRRRYDLARQHHAALRERHEEEHHE